MKAKVATYSHTVALTWASGSNEGSRHIGGLLPIAIQWHEAGSQVCASDGGNVMASSRLMEARKAENQGGKEGQRSKE